jgi:hypothetical protein
MRFKICFRPAIVNESILFQDNECYGLMDLYDIRTHFPKYKIDPEKISYGRISSHRGQEISLTEEQAEKCSVFYDRSDVVVYVTKYGLNKYIIRTYEPSFIWTYFLKIPIKKNLSYVTINYSLNVDRIVNEWSMHGCPLLWNPNSSDGSCDPQLIEIFEKRELDD